MKPYKTSSCSFDLEFSGPETCIEYNSMSGDRPGDPCCEDAVETTLQHTTIPIFLKAFADKLIPLTGVAKKVDSKLTAAAKSRSKTPENVSDVLENNRSYINGLRVQFAEDEAMLAKMEELKNEVQATIVISPAPAKKSSGIKKEYLAKADSILDESDEVVESKVTKLLSVVDEFNLVRDEHGRPERDSLARLIGAWVEAL